MFKSHISRLFEKLKQNRKKDTADCVAQLSWSDDFSFIRSLKNWAQFGQRHKPVVKGQKDDQLLGQKFSKILSARLLLRDLISGRAGQRRGRLGRALFISLWNYSCIATEHFFLTKKVLATFAFRTGDERKKFFRFPNFALQFEKSKNTTHLSENNFLEKRRMKLQHEKFANSDIFHLGKLRVTAAFLVAYSKRTLGLPTKVHFRRCCECPAHLRPIRSAFGPDPLRNT